MTGHHPYPARRPAPLWVRIVAAPLLLVVAAGLLVWTVATVAWLCLALGIERPLR